MNFEGTLGELAAHCIDLLDAVRKTNRASKALLADDLEHALRLAPGALDDDALLSLVIALTRLAGGSLTIEFSSEGPYVRVHAPTWRRAIGDVLIRIRELLLASSHVEAPAAVVARWCQRDGSRTFPRDLLEQLQSEAPNFGLHLVVPETERLQGDAMLRFDRSPSFVLDPVLARRVERPEKSAPGDDLLHTYTDFERYRSAEQQALVHALSEADGPRNVLGVLPTGGGKSLSFILPSLARTRGGAEPGLTIVVSPILALMNDQVEQVSRRYRLKSPDFAVAQLNSTIDHDVRRETYRRLEEGSLHLLYLSPETLTRPKFLHTLLRSPVPIHALVVDEAHMIREWGEDFRCEFQRLGAVRDELRDRFPDLRTLLLSATLPAETRDAVLEAMRIAPDECRIVERRALRKEIHHSVLSFDRETSRLDTLIEQLRRLPRPGIIYCTRKPTCDELAAALDAAGFAATRIYNGDTPADARRTILHEFQSGLVDIVIATNAFGLGVDKADVRFDLHYQVPESLDRYYQEVGRAGRDGKSARAMLFYSGVDMGVAHRQAISRLGTPKIVGRLRSMWRRRASIGRWRAREGAFFLLNDSLVPDYAQSGKPRALEAAGDHRHWNHVTLNFLERAGILRIEGTIVRRVRGVCNEPSDARDETERAIVAALSTGKIDMAALGLEPRAAERAVFALEGRRAISIDGHETGVVVEMLRSLEDSALEAELERAVEAHRAEEKQREGDTARAIKAMAHSSGCRAEHFARTYDYPLPVGDCGHCDRCEPANRPPSVSHARVEEETMEEKIRRSVDELVAWYTEQARPALVQKNVHEGVVKQFDDESEAVAVSAATRPRVEVAFLGTATVGKSTTINALVGERVVPENSFGPTTGAQTVIRYGARRRLIVEYHPREVIDTFLQNLRGEWQQLIDESLITGDPVDTSELPVSRARALYLRRFNESTFRLEDLDVPPPEEVLALLGTTREFFEDLENVLWDHAAYTTHAVGLANAYSAIAKSIVLELPHPLFEGGLELVDLPGVGDADVWRTDATTRYLKTAKQFVLLLTADLFTTTVKSLIVGYDLVVNLFQQKRPLLLFGTKLDNVDPTAADREQYGVPPGASLSQARDIVWTGKARAQLAELLRLVIGRVVKKEDGESPQAYDERIARCFARMELIAGNPKAAIELRQGAIPGDPEREARLELWRKLYPAEEDTGIPRLRRELEGVAKVEAERHWRRVSVAGERLHKLLRARLEDALRERAHADTRTAEEHLGGLRARIDTLASRLDAEVTTLASKWERDLESTLEEARRSTGTAGSTRITAHLRKVPPPKAQPHWVRASVNMDRRGIYKTIHVPKALFEELQLRLSQQWTVDIRGDVERIAREIERCRGETANGLEEIPALIEGNASEALRASVAHAAELLRASVERATEGALAEHTRAGLNFPDWVIEGALTGLEQPCKDALAQVGLGSTPKKIEVLARAASSVGDVVAQDMSQHVEKACGVLRDELRAQVVEVQRAIRGVLDDVARTLADVAGGSLHGASDAAVQRALEAMPVWDLPHESLHPETSA